MTQQARSEQRQDWREAAFEAHRPQLWSIAFRMLGSPSDADDALQDVWLRFNRADTAAVDNLGAWLTTVVSRVCLNQLRSRRQRRIEHPLQTADLLIEPDPKSLPEESALRADGVGLALQVVLESLSPAERIAFVLHDLFDVPFADIATVLDRSPQAARKLASRARVRVSRAAEMSQADLDRQREVVDAFFAASRDGDFEALVSILHPEVVRRIDGDVRQGLSRLLRGADQVAAQAIIAGSTSAIVQRVLVNGAPGAVVTPAGLPPLLMVFTLAEDKVSAIDILAAPDRIARWFGMPAANEDYSGTSAHARAQSGS